MTAFVAMQPAANSAAKELDTKNINTKEAARNLKIGLPLNSLFL